MDGRQSTAGAKVFNMATPAKAVSHKDDSNPPVVEVHRSSDKVDKSAPVLPSHLTLAKQLGKGAYGDVFLCDDKLKNCQVAVKWVKDFARDPVFGKRILREIRILAALDHPNLLKLVDLLPVPSPDFNDVYIVMPYMHLDLQKVIYSKMALQLQESHAQAFACQILRGLKYLHSAGVVHRDLKPSNILVNKDCTLRIADLGLARGRVYEEEELTDYVVTRWYRAPELMLQPSGYFEAVDLWSVGCIHVELKTRRPLFPGENHTDMLKRIAGVLRFETQRDLAWLPQGHSRDEVLYMVSSLELEQWPARSTEQCLEERMPDATAGCLDFIRKLLAFNPNTRITAAEALAHPYLDYLVDAAAETCAPQAFAWDFDRFEPTKQALKDRVYRECARLHPEIIARDAEQLSGATQPLGPPPARLVQGRPHRTSTAI